MKRLRREAPRFGKAAGLKNSPRSRRLRLERLEPRRLLALASESLLSPHDLDLFAGGDPAVGLSAMALVPVVDSIVRADSNPTNASSVDFTVTFSTDVTGVDSTDFVPAVDGLGGVSITTVSGSGAVYGVTVGTGSGDGTLRLDLIDDNSIKGSRNKKLGGPHTGDGDHAGDEFYTIDHNAPAVNSIVRANANPTNAASVDFTVTFSEAVTGVTTSDFAPTAVGISGASVTGVSGSDSTYTVSVDTASGNGTLRLDLTDDDTILDAAGNRLGGGGTGYGDFSAGEAYAVDKTPPVVSSVVRADANPTNAASVDFTVTFTEDVTGVDPADFAIIATGVSGTSITAVAGSGAGYTVTVDTGTGDGTIRLDVADNDSSVDSGGTPLGGEGTGNGDYTSGESYIVDRTPDAEIHGTIFNDGNGNEVRDAGEPALENWIVYLDSDSDGQPDSNEPFVQTNADGVYSFTGLAVGSYTVAEVIFDGWEQTLPASGSYSVTLGIDEVVNGRDFANRDVGDTSYRLVGPLDGFATDQDLNGAFESLDVSDVTFRTRLYSAPTSVGEERGLLEFDISSLGASADVSSATLQLHAAILWDAANVDFFGYSGDGALTTADAIGSTTLVGNATVSGLGDLSVAIDPAFVESLLGNTTYLGLVMRIASGTGVAFDATDAGNLPPTWHPTLSIEVVPPAPELSVSIVPDSIVENAGPGAATGTVTRRNMDNSLALLVNLDSSDTSEATVPATVTIAAGRDSATFPVDAVDDTILDGTQTVTISGSAAVSVTPTLDAGFGTVGRVVPNVVSNAIGLQSDGKIVSVGSYYTGVSSDYFDFHISRYNSDGTLDATFGSGGIVVADFGSDESARGVALQPDGKIIVVGGDYDGPAGLARYNPDGTLDSSYFSLSIGDQANDVLVQPDGRFVTAGEQFIARFAGSRQIYASDTLDVTDDESAVLTVTLPASAGEGDGVLSGQGTVSITTAPAIDVDVALSSGDTSEITVPATVTILAGQTSATFDVTIVDDNEIDGTQSATVTAHVDNWTDGAATINVLDNENLDLVVAMPADAWENAGVLAGSGSVSISGTLDSDFVVALGSDDTTELTVPATVTILAGQTSAVFDLTVIDDIEYDGVQTATVSAGATGFNAGSLAMPVRDDDLHHFTWDTIASPQPAGRTFAVTIRAEDIGGDTILVYTDTANLSGSGDGGSVTIVPTVTGAFSAGVWTGDVTVETADSAVTLTADDGSGHSGASNAFAVLRNDVLYVDAESTTPDTDPGIGLNWNKAYKKLQDAMTEASSRFNDADSTNDIHQVWVADGTYVPGPARNQSFFMVTDVAVYGGFQGISAAEPEYSHQRRARDSQGKLLYETVLSGDINGDDADNLTLSELLNHSTRLDNVYRVVYLINRTGVLIDGVTITGGTADYQNSGDGGGVLATAGYGGTCEITLNEVHITGNAASGSGGGIASSRASITLTNSTVTGNMAGNGGAIGNATHGFKSLTVSNSIIAGNVGTYGGAIGAVTDFTITQSIITGNTATKGGGVYAGNVLAKNTIIANNKAIEYPDTSATFEDGSDYNLIGIWEGISAIGDHSLAGTPETPLDAGISDWTLRSDGRWGYYLLSGSPAIDAGDDASAVDPWGNALQTDLYGNPRIEGAAVDIGAVEGYVAPTSGVTYVVEDLGDTVADDGVLTFGEAFLAANTNQPAADAVAGSFADRDRIEFAAGLTGTVSLGGKALQIHSDLSIVGPDASLLSIDAGGLSQIVQVGPTADVDLIDVTLTGGATEVGGGAITNYGSLLLQDVTVSSNTAANYGGGLYNFAPLEIVGSTFANNAARFGDLLVSLASDDTSEVTVPATVTIPDGQTSTTFDVSIVDDSDLDLTQIVTITATATDYLYGSDTIAVADDEMTALSIAVPATVSERDGVLTSQGTVAIDTVATVDVVVELSSDDTTEITVPATVTILAGQTSATFDLTVLDDNQFDGTQIVTIAAHVDNWIDGTAVISVLDNLTLDITLPIGDWESQGTLALGGTVVMAGTLGADLVVSLSSDDTSELEVPPTVTIPAGQSSASFDLMLVDDALNDGVQTPTIWPEHPTTRKAWSCPPYSPFSRPRQPLEAWSSTCKAPRQPTSWTPGSTSMPTAIGPIRGSRFSPPSTWAVRPALKRSTSPFHNIPART